MSEEVKSEETANKNGGALGNLSMGVWIGIAAAALVVGLLIGHFALPGGGAAGIATIGKATLSEGELNSVVGTYLFDGTTQNLTAREVIEQNSTIEAAKDADGNYAVPTADTVLAAARNKIISDEAIKRGITVSEDDLSAYAEETLGSSDLESIATSYSMDVETVKLLLEQSALMSRLREEVVGSDLGDAPEAPTAPEVATKDEEGNDLSAEDATAAQEKAYDAPTAEYAEYIIKLAGDEWDAEKGAWASEDGAYATALADYEVTKDGASYNAAQAAYYVAYQDYNTAQAELSAKWSEFVNGLLGSSAISIATLIA